MMEKRMIMTPEAMIDLGRELAEKGHTHILLHGQLGAGKTHFAKGFAIGCKLDPAIVTSPTYTYSNEYADEMLHCDFYRLEDEQELRSKGLIDTIQEYDRVLIEWPKRDEQYADEDRLHVRIEVVSENEREVEIVKWG